MRPLSYPKLFRIPLLCTASLLFVLATSIFAQEILVRTDHENGLYTAGETVRWDLEVKGDAAQLKDARYELCIGGQRSATNTSLRFENGKSIVVAKSVKPDWLLLRVTAKNAEGKDLSIHSGALFSPEKIQPSSPRPDDFDAFWAAKLQELASVPANPVLTQGVSGKDTIDYFYLTMQNIRGSRINGQLAKPKGEGKFPACLIVQWAGVYPLKKDWILGRAEQGYLTLNIIAHDLPIANPDDYYDGLKEGALKDYPAIGNEDRNTSYFLRMYLSCYRAAEYLCSRPDWDGRIFLVTGGSQGGLQALVTASLHPKVTAVVVEVPAGCDQSGPSVGRLPGWPQWVLNAHGRDAAKIAKAASYYDVVNFVPNIKCPVLACVGLIDTVCNPAGIYAAMNQIHSPKEIVVMPKADHQKHHQAYEARRDAWYAAIKDGKVPLAP